MVILALMLRYVIFCESLMFLNMLRLSKPEALPEGQNHHFATGSSANNIIR